MLAARVSAMDENQFQKSSVSLFIFSDFISLVVKVGYSSVLINMFLFFDPSFLSVSGVIFVNDFGLCAIAAII